MRLSVSRAIELTRMRTCTLCYHQAHLARFVAGLPNTDVAVLFHGKRNVKKEGSYKFCLKQSGGYDTTPGLTREN